MTGEGGRTFFHSCEVDADIQRLLNPAEQVTEPWGRGLYRYLAGEPEAQIEGKALVELEGPISEERDLDADAGALLVCPERIVSVTPLDPSLVEAIRARDA